MHCVIRGMLIPASWQGGSRLLAKLDSEHVPFSSQMCNLTGQRIHPLPHALHGSLRTGCYLTTCMHNIITSRVRHQQDATR